jgi:hypothetical protein
MQGIPDLTLLYKKRWGILEVKGFEDAPVQPNQEFYIDELNRMSYAAFVYPENEEDVVRELQRAFYPGRRPRIS